MKKSVLTAISAAVTVFLLAGCGGGDTAEAPAATPTEETTDEATDETTEAPAEESATDPTDESGDGYVVDQEAALDLFVAAGNEMAPSLLEGSEDVYSSVKFEAAPPDTARMVWTFIDQVPDEYLEQVRAATEETVPQLQEGFDTELFGAMEDAGIESPKLEVVFLNPDGSEIWSHLFEPTEPEV